MQGGAGAQRTAADELAHRRVAHHMNLILSSLAAAAALCIAAYAQLRVGRYTASRSAACLTRGVLLLVGLGFGYVATVTYSADDVTRALAMMIGFGAVHLPAAFILFVKR